MLVYAYRAQRRAGRFHGLAERILAVNPVKAAFVGCNAVERTPTIPARRLITQGRHGASDRLAATHCLVK